MTKVITSEIKEAIVGEFIEDKDLLNRPIKLRIMATELEPFTSNEGKEMLRVIFYFENNKKEQKQISSLSFAGLARQMNIVDPDVGDILQLETIEVKGEKYLVWKVEIVQKTAEDIPAKEAKTAVKEPLPEKTKGAVNKGDDEESEIRIEDIPF